MHETGSENWIFSAEDVHKIYDMGEVQVSALRGVSLRLYPSELTVILGPSGSGKSTLVNILGGLDVPTTGRVRFRDIDLTACNDRELTLFRRRHVGFVFQFYNLIPSLTARENVELVTEISVNPMPPEEALHVVGLSKRMDHFPAQLSGGEQQRVAIARAISRQPDVLLCDEPTGALDVETGIRVLQALQHINQKLGTCVVIITHNTSIADIADRVIRVSGGRIVDDKQNEQKRPATEVSW